MRTTDKQVRGVFGHLAKALGKRVATSPSDKGAWLIDNDGTGYVVVELDGRGWNMPFGTERRKASDMWSHMAFALRVLEQR